MAAKRKGSVFRVTGLPASQPDDTLTTSLIVIINDKLNEKERQELHIEAAIVSTCYNEGRRVALVEFCDKVPLSYRSGKTNRSKTAKKYLSMTPMLISISALTASLNYIHQH